MEKYQNNNSSVNKRDDDSFRLHRVDKMEPFKIEIVSPEFCDKIAEMIATTNGAITTLDDITDNIKKPVTMDIDADLYKSLLMLGEKDEVELVCKYIAVNRILTCDSNKGFLGMIKKVKDNLKEIPLHMRHVLTSDAYMKIFGMIPAAYLASVCNLGDVKTEVGKMDKSTEKVAVEIMSAIKDQCVCEDNSLSEAYSVVTEVVERFLFAYRDKNLIDLGNIRKIIADSFDGEMKEYFSKLLKKIDADMKESFSKFTELVKEMKESDAKGMEQDTPDPMEYDPVDIPPEENATAQDADTGMQVDLSIIDTMNADQQQQNPAGGVNTGLEDNGASADNTAPAQPGSGGVVTGLESVIDPDSVYYDGWMAAVEFTLMESLDYFEEKSHRNLKFDHRLAYRIDENGEKHPVHVVYSLDGMKLTQNNVVDTENGPIRVAQGGKLDDSEYHKIKRYGNTDHESSGQKVLAIIDMETGEKKDSATLSGVFSGSTVNNHKITVGEVDNTPTFKSTYWSPRKDRNSENEISHREKTGRTRGVKAERDDDIMVSSWSADQWIVDYKNQIKRQEEILDDLKKEKAEKPGHEDYYDREIRSTTSMINKLKDLLSEEKQKQRSWTNRKRQERQSKMEPKDPAKREEWRKHHPDAADKKNESVEEMNEAFGFKKKLKRISRDSVGYVRIRGANAVDADTLCMVVAYGYSIVERCEWYMELIQSGDSRYIVPQTYGELDSIKKDMTNVLDKLMENPIVRKRSVIRDYYNV